MPPLNDDDHNNNNNNRTNDECRLNLTTGAQQPRVKTESYPTNQPSRTPIEGPVGGTMSEEELVAMGIDINEIRAQREIERRLEEEAKQQEYAERLQAEFNREYSTMVQQQAPMQAGSSSSSTTTAPTSNSPSTSNTSGSAHVASVPPSATGNQLGRLATAPTSSSNAITINITTTNSHSQTPRPVVPPPANTAPKRQMPAASSPSQPKRRRARRYWVFPGESIPEDDSSDEDTAIIMGESSGRNSNSNLNNHTINPNSSSIHGPNGTTSSAVLGQPSTACNSNGSRLHQILTPRSNTAKAKGVATTPVNEIGTWMDIVPDDDAAPEIPSNALDDLDVTLMKHQQAGFKWMYQQETAENKGGLLCDDMGLGKTIQSLALIVSRRCPNPDILPANPPHMLSWSPRIKPLVAKSTLVICPVNLMTQWAEEVQTKTKNLSVHINHGVARTCDPYTLARFDVIITSYNTLGSEYSAVERSQNLNGGIFSLIYHRVILDEAHSIKNHKAHQTRACFALKTIHKWCLTATPIQSKIDDMYSLIQFLGISPYDELFTFKYKIELPLTSGDSSEKEEARKLFKTFALRRSKNMMVGDQPVIKLPERKIHVTYVDYTPEERKFYDSVNTRVLSEINFRGQDTVIIQSHATMMVHLLRLRQACLHPTLSVFPQPIVQTAKSMQMKIASSLGERVVDRLLSIKNELAFTECPICMDIADQPRIISTCGHILCAVCLNNYIHSTSCFYNGRKSCPECRGVLQPEKVIPVDVFLEVHDTVPTPVSSASPINVANESNAIGSSKIKTMLSILEKTRQDSGGADKTIIFSHFTSMLDTIGKALNAMDIKHRRYDGTVTVHKRGPILAEFETNPSLSVLLVSTKCGAVGLNLTMANKVIIMDVGCNPLMENQAIGRVHRIGQTKKVEVHRLVVRDSVEERLMAFQAKKQDMSDSALDGGSKNTTDSLTKIGRNEWLYLFGNIPLPGSAVAGPSRS